MPSRTRVALILAVVLLGLLAIVAVASSGSGGGGEAGDPAPANAFWDYLVTLLLGGAAGSVGLLIWLLAKERGTQQSPRKGQNLRALIIFGAVLLALVLIVRSDRIRLPGQGDGNRGQVGTATSPAATTSPPADPYDPRFRWELLAALGGLAATTAVVFSVYNRRGRSRPRTAEELAEELADLLDDTLDDLRREPDPRRAVVAAYARMERILALHGLARRPFEAPLEYLDRIAPELPAASASRLVFELTHLYERARFSQHEIDEGMKAEAIETLVALRDELTEEAAAA